MELSIRTDALTALGHPDRLAVFRLLARRAPDGVRPSEIAEALSLKRNTLSVHVSALARTGLVRSWREGKSAFYSIDLARVGALIDFLVNDCCRGRPELCVSLAPARNPMKKPEALSDRMFNVLFICTGNSARSIFAEAILSQIGGGKFRVFSAGTQPFSELNPIVIKLLESLGYGVSQLRSKHLSEFQRPDAPKMDFVFTVCDQAANEECPPWPGQPISAHWGMPDPVKATGTEAERILAFREAYRTLRHRLEGFAALQITALDRVSLQRRLDQIGRENSPPMAP